MGWDDPREAGEAGEQGRNFFYYSHVGTQELGVHGPCKCCSNDPFCLTRGRLKEPLFGPFLDRKMLTSNVNELSSQYLLSVFFFLFFVFFFQVGELHPEHIEAPRIGVELEPQQCQI